MDSIQLERKKWIVGDQLGEGGFGRVFHGTSRDGETAVAIKFIPKAPEAKRELLFVDLAGIPNVVPILDTGETDDDYVIVMPLAECSLRGHFDANGLPMTLDGITPVLTDVATALAELSGKVVHRDVKPENVLRLDGKWCLADFGISRYAEATTGDNTNKFALTPLYAAPERWRFEQAHGATDIYALGCIAYEMASGHTPFAGPDFRRAHLEEEPAPLVDCDSSLAGLISECMLKAPEARPTPENLLARLAGLERPKSEAAERLRAANKQAVDAKMADSASASAARSEGERRVELRGAAESTLSGIINGLRSEIEGNAAQALFDANPLLNVNLLDAHLSVLPLMAVDEKLERGDYEFFDVVLNTVIALRVPQDRYGYEGRAHSLWFCDASEEGVYRWYETAFMISPHMAQSSRMAPFPLDPHATECLDALSPSMTTRQLAWPFTVIDQGEEGEFVERWLGWFADAAQGKLGMPSNMPERAVTPPQWRWTRVER